MGGSREVISGIHAEDERTSGVASEISSTIVALISEELIWCELKSEALLGLCEVVTLVFGNMMSLGSARSRFAGVFVRC